MLSKPETNIIETLSPAEQKVVRKRLIGSILATDMAKHASEVARLRSLVEAKGITGGKNVEDMIDRTSDSSIFESQ